MRYYQDDQQNRGKAQIMSLAKAKFRNLEQSLIDKWNSLLERYWQLEKIQDWDC